MRLNEFEFCPPAAFQKRCGRLAVLWGGKGNSAPPPDPRLVDAQIRSLGIQDEAISRMTDMAREMAPLQREQLQQTIAQSRQLWAQNQEDREFMLGKRALLSGIQNRIAEEANTFNEAARRDQLAGQASGDVQQAFGQARATMDRDMARMGVNPNDARASAAKGQLALQQALAQVSGRNLAGQQARAERLQLQDRANNALAGYPAMSMGAQGQGLSTMGAGQQAVNSGAAGMLAPHQAVAGAAGSMGNNAANMWGQQNNAYMQGQQAEAAGAGALGSAIGSVAIAAAM